MNQTPDEPLDNLTKLVVRAGGIGDDEAERIGSSPFLHARLRARIDSERNSRAELGSSWFVTLLVASRAIAALMVVTVAAVLTLWLSRASASPVVPPPNVGENDVSRVVIGGTCALSTTAECAISTEEVLATLFADKEGGSLK
jgi:hypothetical protein